MTIQSQRYHDGMPKICPNCGELIVFHTYEGYKNHGLYDIWEKLKQ